MNILPSRKKEEQKPLVPILSHWAVPGVRKMRGRRFNDRGEDIGPCGPRKPIVSAAESARVKKAHEDAGKLPPPQETEGFDLRRFSPLPNRVLLKRPPQITEEKGVRLPENQYRSECWFFVIKVGPGVTVCQPGDRVIFAKKSLPRPVRLGAPYHMGRATAIAAIVEP